MSTGAADAIAKAAAAARATLESGQRISSLSAKLAMAVVESESGKGLAPQEQGGALIAAALLLLSQHMAPEAIAQVLRHTAEGLERGECNAPEA